MNETLSNSIPPSDDDLQPEYRFDYRKAKPNRFAAGNVAKLKVTDLVCPSRWVAAWRGWRSYNRLVRSREGWYGGSVVLPPVDWATG